MAVDTASHRLTPACAVVAMRTSGGAEYDRRIDFAFIRDRIAAHGLKWVAYRREPDRIAAHGLKWVAYRREPDRIARELHAAHSFYKFLQDSGTDLYLCSLGRKVSWDSQGDRLIVGTLGVIGEFERGAIKARTHNAIKSRWLETGRGYPGYKPIGFRRDAQMFLEQDLEQWPYIRQASAMYAQLRSVGGTSVRGLAEFLTDKLGFPINSSCGACAPLPRAMKTSTRMLALSRARSGPASARGVQLQGIVPDRSVIF